MRKKWQLIKEAYDRYPTGTKFTGLGEFEVYVSTGNFDFGGEDIFDVETGGWVYYSGKWATLYKSRKYSKKFISQIEYSDAVQPPNKIEVKPDLLDGKVAIRVNDEHEFKALMKHYEENDWKCDPDTVVPDIVRRYPVYPVYVRYENFYGMALSKHAYTKLGYEYVDFPDFAAQVGIEVRKPLLHSEDDVDLFEGDDYFLACKDAYEKWTCSVLTVKGLAKKDPVINYPERYKAFTNSESAEAWVNYHNLF